MQGLFSYLSLYCTEYDPSCFLGSSLMSHRVSAFVITMLIPRGLLVTIAPCCVTSCSRYDDVESGGYRNEPSP